MNIYSNVNDIEQAILKVGDTVRILGERTEGDIATMTGKVRANGETINNRIVYSKNNLPIEIFPIPATEATKEFVEGEIHDFHTDTVKDIWRADTKITSWVHKIYQEGDYYIPKTVPFTTNATWDEDKPNWVRLDSESSGFRQMFGIAPLDLAAELVINPVNTIYPKLRAFGYLFQLPNNTESYTVKSFAQDAEHNCIITLSNDQQVKAYKVNTVTMYDMDNIHVKATGANISRLLADRLGDIMYAKDYGVKADGITDDWEALQDLIITARRTSRTVYLPGGVILISKPLYITADSLDKAKASVNGEGIQTAHEYDSIKIVGAGIRDTIIKYTGLNHAVQVGEFADSNYGGSNHATYYGCLQDLTIKATNAKYGLVLSWCHYYQLERLKVEDGSISTVRFFNGSGIHECLWNKIESCHFAGQGQRNLMLRGNSNTIIDTFCGYGSQAVVQVIGHRNTFLRLSMENIAASGATPYFIECWGGCSFYDPEMETGVGGVINGFHFKTDHQVVIQNPTIVGITGQRFVVDSSIPNPRIMLIGAETQHNLAGNEQTIKALGSGTVAMPNVKTLTKQKKRTQTISLGANPNWSAFQNIAAGNTTTGYGSGILLQGITLSNAVGVGAYGPTVQLRLYRGDDSFVDFGAVTGPAEGGQAISYDQKDLGFAMYFDDNQYTRLIAARGKAAGGTVDVTVYYIEV